MTAGEPPPRLIERRVACVRGRGLDVQKMPDRLAGELLEPEVGARRELHDLHVLLDERDERQEQRAVQSVLIELLRRDVGGRHHDDAQLEQTREQSTEDHGVSDVGDVEFVETQEPCLLGDRRGRKPDRILAADRAELDLAAKLAHAVVHVAHELMKVRAPLALHCARREEQIHQHGLATPDIAVKVETADRLFATLARTEQPAER